MVCHRQQKPCPAFPPSLLLSPTQHPSTWEGLSCLAAPGSRRKVVVAADDKNPEDFKLSLPQETGKPRQHPENHSIFQVPEPGKASGSQVLL